MDNSEARRWLLSAEQLKEYRTIAPQLRFFEQSRMLSMEAREQTERLCKRFIEGQLSLDLFLNELNNLARLVYQEQQ